MSILNQLVSFMSKEDVRHLKLYLNRTRSNKDNRKDVELFDYIRKTGQKYDESRIFQKLYDSKDKNALYRLKNRLLDDITKSVTLQYFQELESNQVLQLIAISRLYLHKGHFEVANHFLKKAEKKATDIEAYELLDLIYSDFIRHSHETLNINPEVYISRRAENRTTVNQLREIDDLLAVLIYRLKISQGMASEAAPVVETLKKTIEEHSKSLDLDKNPKLRFKIYDAVSRILLQQHDYDVLEDYLNSTLEEFTRDGLFTKITHDTKLQMLTYLANSLFKNNKIEESLKVAGQLKENMEAYNRASYNKYLFYYYNMLVYNYSVLDKERAIAVMQEAMDDPELSKVPMNRIIFHIQMALRYFDMREYRKANRSLVQVKFEDIYRTLDQALQLKVGVAELIIRYEMEDYDFIDYQVSRLKRNFEKLLKQPEYARQKDMLAILTRMIYSPRIKHDDDLVQSINNLVASLPDEDAADQDLPNYNEWLRTKIE